MSFESEMNNILEHHSDGVDHAQMRDCDLCKSRLIAAHKKDIARHYEEMYDWVNSSPEATLSAFDALLYIDLELKDLTSDSPDGERGASNGS